MAVEGEVQGGGAAESSAPVSQEGLESRLSSALPADSGGGRPGSAADLAGGGQAAAAAAGQQPAEAQSAEYQGLVDYARSQGVALPPQWKDDAQAFQGLAQAYRQLQERNYYAEVGQRIAPYADQVQEYLRQRQQQATQQQGQPKSWAAPAFKREWLQMVETDPETNQLRAKPGYDPSLPEKIQAYSDWRDRFLQSPDDVLKPWVAEEASRIVEERMAGYQEQQVANGLIAREATWMFQGGQVGGQLTAAGQMYNRAVNQFYQGGLRDVRSLHAAAVSVVQNAFLRQQAQAGKTTQTPAQTPAQQADQPLSVAGAIARRGGGARSPSKQDTQPMLSMRERLMTKLGANGVGE